MPTAVTTETVDFQSGSLTIPAYLAYPEATDSRPVVVVVQEVFGVNEHIQAVTRQLAEAGYVAIAPHIYHRQVQNFSVGYSPEELALGRRYKVGTNAAELLSDVQGAIAYCQKRFSAPEKAGCIGFCFGGHVTYLAATLPAVAAAAVFYGAGIVSSTPGGGEPTIARTQEIQGTLYGFFGLQDPLIPVSEVDVIESALKQAGVQHRIFRYPNASHGFFCDYRESYQPDAAKDAWQQVTTLFHQTLP